jgi:hypothetical protein
LSSRNVSILGIALLALIGLVCVLLQEHASAVASGSNKAIVIFGNDDDTMLIPARSLIHWQQPPAAVGFNYPAPTYVLYAPLGIIPAGLGDALAIMLSAAFVVAALYAWARISGATRGLWFVVLSAPVVNLIHIIQINTAVGLATLIGAYIAMSRNRMFIAGILLALSLCRITNGLPIAVAIMANALYRRPRVGLAITSGFVLTLTPAFVIAFLWYPHWLSTVGAAGTAFALYGGPEIARVLLGNSGPQILLIGVCVIITGLTISSRRIIPSPEMYALLLAFTILPTHLGAMYVGVFALPAILILSRDHLSWALATTISIWLLTIITSLSIVPNPRELAPPVQIAFDMLVLTPLILAAIAATEVGRRILSTNRLTKMVSGG